MRQIVYTLDHGDWVEDVYMDWTDDQAFLEGMIKHLKKKKALNIRVYKRVDVSPDYL